VKLENRICFGKWEAVTLLINLICTKIFLYFARMTVEDAGTAGWILTIYICLLSLFLYIFLVRFMGKFEGKDLIDIAGIAGGRTIRMITGLIVTITLFYLTTTVLREFAEDMKIISLPASPISYIMIIFILGVITGSFLGIEAIMRYHAIIVPIIATGFLIIILGVIPKMDLTNVLPILGNGAYDIFGKGFFKVSVFGELLILFLLPPFLGSHKNVKTVGFVAIGFSSLFLISGSLSYILTFPYPSNLESFLPIYQLSRLINLGRFFQRIEAVFLFIWAMAAFIYLTAVFYFMVYTFAKTAGLKYMRPLILPFGILVFSAAFIPRNLMAVVGMNIQFFSKTAWLVTFVFTGAILVIANFRKHPEKEDADG
jgi:spore germination protein (amino acid permease)